MSADVIPLFPHRTDDCLRRVAEEGRAGMERVREQFERRQRNRRPTHKPDNDPPPRAA